MPSMNRSAYRLPSCRATRRALGLVETAAVGVCDAMNQSGSMNTPSAPAMLRGGVRTGGGGGVGVVCLQRDGLYDGEDDAWKRRELRSHF